MLIDKEKNTVYIYCPARYASGGPEVLHQLGYKLKNYGIKVFIAYYPHVNSNPVHDNYKEYELEWVYDVPDTGCSFVILPETYADLHRRFNNACVSIWWLSVDNYFLGSLNKVKKYTNGVIKEILDYSSMLFFDKTLLNPKYTYFVQSKYAELFLLKKGARGDLIYNLSDYLHHDVLSYKYDKNKKENIVAYNPSKGFKFAKRIIKENKDIDFVPIQNMTRKEVLKLLERSKLYMDFGFHPGKDRIPREAAYLGCCIIVGRKGSVNNMVDVNIPEKYKFNCSRGDISEISSNLKYILTHYDKCYEDLKEYVCSIEKEEKDFEDDIVRMLWIDK